MKITKKNELKKEKRRRGRHMEKKVIDRKREKGGVKNMYNEKEKENKK